MNPWNNDHHLNKKIEKEKAAQEDWNCVEQHQTLFAVVLFSLTKCPFLPPSVFPSHQETIYL